MVWLKPEFGKFDIEEISRDRRDLPVGFEGRSPCLPKIRCWWIRELSISSVWSEAFVDVAQRRWRSWRRRSGRRWWSCRRYWLMAKYFSTAQDPNWFGKGRARSLLVNPSAKVTRIVEETIDPWAWAVERPCSVARLWSEPAQCDCKDIKLWQQALTRPNDCEKERNPPRWDTSSARDISALRFFQTWTNSKSDIKRDMFQDLFHLTCKTWKPKKPVLPKEDGETPRTGANSGIGKEIAQFLATKGGNKKFDHYRYWILNHGVCLRGEGVDICRSTALSLLLFPDVPFLEGKTRFQRFSWQVDGIPMFEQRHFEKFKLWFGSPQPKFQSAQLAPGATLYMICRSKDRANAARDEIVAAAAGLGGCNNFDFDHFFFAINKHVWWNEVGMIWLLKHKLNFIAKESKEIPPAECMYCWLTAV